MSACPACDYANVPGTLFCEGCGHGLMPEAHGKGEAADSAATTQAMAAPDAGMRHRRLATEDISAAASAVRATAPGEIAAEGKQARAEDAAPPETVAAQPEPAYAGHSSAQPGMASTYEPRPSTSPTMAPAAATAATAATVSLVSESGRRVDVPFQDVVIVGREDMRSGIRPDVDLTLDGASVAGVSRRHCRLLHQPDGWYVEDLMSTNYTVLNGKPLRAHAPTRVTHGDELRLGKLRLRFYEA